MERVSIADFAKDKGFTQIADTVRTNVNGYPYITFITDDNKAENIYFSKSGAEKVMEGEVVNKDLLADFEISIYDNDDGEQRIKLSRKTARLSIADLF